MRLHALLLASSLWLGGCGAAVASASKTATQNAVNTLTSKQDIAQVDKLVTSAVSHARDTALDDTTAKRASVIVDTAINPAKVATWREELAGPPLQRDLDALIAHEKPQLADLVQTTSAPLGVEADKWRTVAVYAIGALCALHLLHLVLSFVERLRRRTRRTST